MVLSKELEEKKRLLFSKKLKLLRINAFFSQQEMALKFKISQQGYSKLESGESRFSPEKIDTICKIFKISFDEFVTITRPPKKTDPSAPDSHNIKTLKLHYEQLLLGQELKIRQLEAQLLRHTKIRSRLKKN